MIAASFVGRPALSRVVMPLIAALILAGGIVPRTAGASPSPARAAKKVCKTVKKHGKKRKVCHTVKATPAPTPTPTVRPIDYAAQAQTLADGLAAAQSADARYTALLAIMQALHLSVFGNTGTPVSAGTADSATERSQAHSAADFYLYDFELKGLAASFVSAKPAGADRLGATLAPFNGGAAPDPATFLAGIRAGTQAALAAPTDIHSLPLLLVRQLGLHHATPQDSAQDLGSSVLQLDPVQEMLLLADVLLPQAQSTTARLREARDARDRVQDCGGSSPKCDPFEGSPGGSNPFMKLREDQLQDALDALHAEGLREALSITVGPDQISHYGPENHELHAGDAVDEQVSVTWLLGQSGPTAGWLKDVKLPQGINGVQGVGVKWQDLGASLRQHAAHFLEDSTTDDTGRAQRYAAPPDEAVPGFGSEVSTGEVTTDIELQLSKAFAGLPGKVGTFLDQGYTSTVPGVASVPELRPLSVHWTMSRHAPRGFVFRNLTFDATLPGFGVQHYFFSGSMCGEDPYTGEWTIHTDWTTSAGGAGSEYPINTTIPQGTGKDLKYAGGSYHPWFSIRFVVDGKQPEVVMSPDNAPDTVTPSESVARVEEDDRCPAPQP